ncbi:MAG: nucleoside-diphosphate kinase [Elusimicrobia bacterium]|nr:nucleoside-diphosphate kinase [Candidatus Obscuribacterium magneticum]
MAIQFTLVLIKPDAIKRSLMGRVLTKLEEAKLNLIAARLTKVSPELAAEHYAQHYGKPFYNQLMDYITGKIHGAPHDKVLALVYEGENAIQSIRHLCGDTNPEKAQSNTIRGMFGRIMTTGLMENVVHASATPPEAEREIKLWFKPDEITRDIFPTKIVNGTRVWERIPAVSEL